MRERASVRAGVGRAGNRALFQPVANLKLGTYYLRGLLDRFGGKWEPTLAAYNAGKSHVDEWIAWNAYREPAEFVESIPFTETREYVEAVMRNAAIYRNLYAAPKPAPKPRVRKRTANGARGGT